MSYVMVRKPCMVSETFLLVCASTLVLSHTLSGNIVGKGQGVYLKGKALLADLTPF